MCRGVFIAEEYLGGLTNIGDQGPWWTETDDAAVAGGEAAMKEAGLEQVLETLQDGP